MGEEKVKKGDHAEKKKDDGKDGSGPIVLKTDLHCEGCAMKIKKAIKSLEGVEKVSTDRSTNKISVTGNADPWEIKEKLEAKIKKKVELISPAGPKKEKAKEKEKEKDKDKEKEKGKDGGKEGKSKDVKGKDKGEKEKKEKDKGEKEKPKEMPESTVVLKIRLHCEGCVGRIRRHILKIKGVKDVAIDSAKDLVTVKGTMDAKSLPAVLKEKLKRTVEVVAGKEKGSGGGGEEKKDKKEKKDDSKEGKEKTEKSDDQKASQAPVMPYQPMFMGPMGGPMGPAGHMGPMGHMPMPMGPMGGPNGGPMGGYMPMAPTGHMPAPMDANRYDYFPPAYPPSYPPPAYRSDMMHHAPQMFSDENPNACSVM
ncbi:heavy metal-associated protein [Carex littledalei]|uniref:Heavy metal-associated protein n=1 Tax=Carex littledalei TaxID=544730 RepID=A0A833QTB1_9POAL|nr:heavy metal-associated protein [Carex littledalei]